MASANQAARLNARQFHRRFRVFALPAPSFVSSDWLAAGQPIQNLPNELTTTDAETSRSTIIGVSDTLSTNGWPVTGEFCLIGEEDGERRVMWFSYGARQPSPPAFLGCKHIHGDVGNIDAGATVTVALDITDIVLDAGWGEREELNHYGAPVVYDYDGFIAGEEYDARDIRPDATYVIEEILTPEGAFNPLANYEEDWTGWQIAVVGYASRDVTATIDADGRRRWELPLTSLSTYFRRYRLSARSYGKLDLALGKSVWTTSELGNGPVLEPEEFPYGGSSTSGDNLTDGNTATVWISAGTPTAEPETPGAGNNNTAAEPLVDQVFISPLAGMPADFWWAQITAPRNSDPFNLAAYGAVLTSRSTSWDQTVWPDLPPGLEDGFVPLPDIELSNASIPQIVLTNDRVVFESYYGTPDVPIFDIRDIEFHPPDWQPGGTPPLFPGRAHSLFLDRDHLTMRFINPGYWTLNTGLHNMVRDVVSWGTWATPSDIFENGDRWAEWSTDGGSTTAQGLTVPDTGESLRRMPTQTDTDEPDDWDVEEEPEPGEVLSIQDWEAASVDLGEFSIFPAAAMSDSDPATGENFVITDATPLPNSTGGDVIQIGSEKIHYTSRTADTLINITRGYDSTTPAAHADSDPISYVHDTMGAIRLYAIGSVTVERFPIVVGGVNIIPTTVDLFGSTEETPDRPPTTGWGADWQLINKTRVPNTHPWSLVWDLSTNQNLRFRHVMVRIRRMSDGGRAKMNMIRIRHFHNADSPYGGSGYAAAAKDMLSERIDPSQWTFDYGAFYGTPNEVVIPESDLASALRNLCTASLTTMRYERDGRTITFSPHPAHPLLSRPDSEMTLDGDSFREPLSRRHASKNKIGQVIVRAYFQRAGHSRVGVYPPVSTNNVDVRAEIDALWSSDAPRHAAEALWLDHPENSGYWEGHTTGPAEWIEAGMRFVIESPLEGAPGTTVLLNARVVEVRHNVRGGNPDDRVEWLRLKWWRTR